MSGRRALGLAVPAVAAVVLAGSALLAVWPAVAQPVGPGSEDQPAGEVPVGDPDDDDLVDEGRRLFLTGCSSCHGLDGEGVADRGPSLEGAGQAAAYYYLTTGRMPLANSREVPRRKDPAYDGDEIEALVAYVAALAPDGPTVPEVDPEAGDLARGGELYRDSCAPCHSAGGIGGALSYGRAAPSVHPAEPHQIAAAVRAGPGQMPRFGHDAISNAELDDLVRYVRYIDSPDSPGGAALGQAGPIPEGFVAWIFGVGALLLAAVWIGKRQTSDR